MDISRLLPFQGLHTSLIGFATGHTFRISHWSSTPTEFGPFSNLWMVTPDGRRVLFADPRESARVVRIYHNFDEEHGSQISLERPEPMDVHMLSAADDGTSVTIILRLAPSRAATLLAALSRAIPLSWITNDLSIQIVSALASKLIANGPMRIAGTTDTGQPFFAGYANELLLVKGANALLNGSHLGAMCPPRTKVTFGDFQASARSYVTVGKLYLPYEEPA